LDLKDYPKEYRIYRALEILPGALAWSTFLLMIFVSYRAPAYAAVFIIVFDIYWLLRTIYLSLHLRSSYKIMKKNIEIPWRDKLERLEKEKYKIPVSSWRDIWHAIIIPVLQESYEVISSSLDSILNSGYPLERIIVVIAAEKRGGKNLSETIDKIEQKYSKIFENFMITWHPEGLPGEIPGKGSNEAWAGRELVEKIIKPKGIMLENVVVSVFDADTTVHKNFFECLTYHYITCQNPLHSSFQPIPLFVNNIWYAPAFARVMGFSSTFWQMMQQARPERLITFSSHSMPLKAVVEIGFWQPNVVSEDSRIFYQCFLYYDGDWNVVPLYFPVSMDANFAGTFWGTLKNQYRQQRRWGYGVENIPYLIYGCLKNKRIPFNKKFSQIFSIIEGFHSWATNSILIFFLGWLPLVIGKDQAFFHTVLSFSLPQITKWIMTLAMVGIITSSVLSISLLPPRPPWFGRWKMFFMVVQWVLLPFNILFLSTIPAIEAQTRLMLGKYMGFWSTPKVRKKLTS
jgi:hypothetical protein